MPKDTKKFINPLLRSSQDSAPSVPSTPGTPGTPTLSKPESVVTAVSPAQRTTDEETQQSPSSESDISSSQELSQTDSRTGPKLSSINEPSAISAPSTLPVEPVEPVAFVAATDPLAPSPVAPSRTEVLPPTKDATTKRTRTSAPSSRPGREEKIDEPVETSSFTHDDVPAAYSSATAASVRQENTANKGTGTRESFTEVSRQKETTMPRQTRQIAKEAAAPIETVLMRSIDQNEEDEPKAAPRRRRGAPPFEATHERITLWIDKQLKQDFEDLAYDRNLSKTRLLDEAMAELLKKYGIR
ncbi:hypothetical protein ccbrp13_06680 [Ktedonobacteria bacterium brp13]|nr:hypothetical protein ccbrp13_06680 [Ktedonobacteria bacterium brp13]